jgi:acyl-CoA reductase-like NAD-dependent aldehyde dehydrogenase
MQMEQTLLINGTQRTGAMSAAVINPWSGDEVVRAALADAALVEEALSGAVEASRRVAQMPSYERAAVLRRVAEMLRVDRQIVAEEIVRQVGKPISYALGEVDRAIITCSLAAEEATRLNGEVLPLDIAPGTERKLSISRRFPVGVVLAITPFNFPLNLSLHKTAPAFAAGNATILKPPPQAPLTGLRLGRMFLEAGAPAGAVQVVPCANDLAEAMARDARVDLVSFTGSARVGWHLRSVCGAKPVVLELGGNSAVIVEDGEEIDRVAAQITASAFAYAGQVCISTQRIFVRKEIADRLIPALVLAANACPSGDPGNPSTVAGPMIDDAAAARVSSWLAEAVHQGARVLCGGTVEGRMVAPTLLTNVPHGAKVCCEEVFAPIAIIEEYSDFADALALANESQFGLQAGVYVRDIDKVMLAHSTLRVGAVILNNVPSVRIDAMPYGGVKGSGLGKEGVRSAMRDMTEERLLVLHAP